MPFTAKQQRAAGAELDRRRKGGKRGKPSRNRPMAKVSIKDLRDLASGPIKRKAKA